MSLHQDPITIEAVDLLATQGPITTVKGLLQQLKELIELEGRAKQVLRDKGYGWTGLDIYETCKLVPDNPEK